MQQVAADALSAYGDSLATNPVPTKLLTAAFLVTLGDACSQLTESSGEDLKYDWNRGLSFAIFGAVYTGAFQHWWFLFLNSVVQVAPDAGDLELWLAAAAKTGLCQFGTIPLVYLPLFFLLTGALRGLTLEQSMARARSSYLPLFWRNITYWIPVQMAQFLIVDPEWQVPYVCSAGFVWSIFLSRFAGPIQEADSQSESQAYPEKGSEVHFQMPDADKESPVLLHRLQTRLHLEHRPEDEKAARVLGDHVAHAGGAPAAHEIEELEELVALEPVLSDGE